MTRPTACPRATTHHAGTARPHPRRPRRPFTEGARALLPLADRAVDAVGDLTDAGFDLTARFPGCPDARALARALDALDQAIAAVWLCFSDLTGGASGSREVAP